MTRFRQSSVWTLGVAALSVSFAISGCGSDESVTPSCPELPLYDAANVEDPANLAARQAAHDTKAGPCVTMPGDASSNLPTTNTGGTGGTGGSGGSGGSSGSAGSGGSAGTVQDAGGD